MIGVRYGGRQDVEREISVRAVRVRVSVRAVHVSLRQVWIDSELQKHAIDTGWVSGEIDKLEDCRLSSCCSACSHATHRFISFFFIGCRQYFCGRRADMKQTEFIPIIAMVLKGYLRGV